jgi:hypothetical protein
MPEDDFFATDRFSGSSNAVAETSKTRAGALKQFEVSTLRPLMNFVRKTINVASKVILNH